MGKRDREKEEKRIRGTQGRQRRETNRRVDNVQRGKGKKYERRQQRREENRKQWK